MLSLLLLSAIGIVVEDFFDQEVKLSSFLINLAPIFLLKPEISWLTIVFLLGGVLSLKISFGFGEADFFLMSFWSLYLDLVGVLKVLLIASIVGIIVSILTQKNRISFLPCLWIGLFVSIR